MKFFNYDGPFVTAVLYVWNMIVLNLLFLLTCLPIFTIGTSVTALYSVYMNRSVESSLIKRYFLAFKSNFRTTVGPWLVFLGVLLVLLVDLYLVFIVKVPGTVVLLTAFIIIALIWVIIATWFFALRARYETTIIQTLKNAVILGFGKLPITILTAVLWLVLPVSLFGDLKLILIVAFIYAHIGFSIAARFGGWIIKKSLSKMEK